MQNKLSKKRFQAALQWINDYGRNLEKYYVSYLFFKNDPKPFLQTLQTYQNEDGGFGNGLEPDIRLPASSPVATAVAFQSLIQFDEHPLAISMIRKGIHYFEQTYLEGRQGWLAVPVKTNHYPHAFWWHVHEDGKSFIDHHWGNPSAEIIGYLYKYNQFVKELDVEALVTKAIDYLNRLETFQSEHELYCYKRLHTLLPTELKAQFFKKLNKGIIEVAELDASKWKDYVPSPLKFVENPNEVGINFDMAKIDQNLNYLVYQLEEAEHISPPWSWNDYPEAWEKAKLEWTGVLTLDALIKLKRFNRI